MEQLGEQDNEWERRKRAESIVKAKRGSQIGSRVGTKNRREEQGGRPSKVRKYALLDREWETKTIGEGSSSPDPVKEGAHGEGRGAAMPDRY